MLTKKKKVVALVYAVFGKGRPAWICRPQISYCSLTQWAFLDWATPSETYACTYGSRIADPWSTELGPRARYVWLVIIIWFALRKHFLQGLFDLWGFFLGTMGQSGAPLCAWRRIDVAHAGIEKCTLACDVFLCVLLH